jgi:MFS family permease
MRAERLAVSTLFFLNGAVLASWVPHIPAVKARHGATDAQLGVVLLAPALGAMIALPLAGWLVGRFGSRAVTRASATAFCLALPLPVVSPSLPLVALALVVLGACNGLLDVSMNTQAAAVERRYGRALMSSFHALFSVGGVVGASLAGAAMAAGVGDAAHVLIATLVALAAASAALPRLVPSDPDHERAGRGTRGPRVQGACRWDERRPGLGGGDDRLSRLPDRASAHRIRGGRGRVGAGAGAGQRRLRADRGGGGDGLARGAR